MFRQFIANAFLNLRRLKRNKQDKKKTSALRPPGDSESCSIRCRMLEFFKNNFNLITIFCIDEPRSSTLFIVFFGNFIYKVSKGARKKIGAIFSAM